MQYFNLKHLLVCCFLFFNSISIAQTKTETIKWLNSKMPTKATMFPDSFGNLEGTSIKILSTGDFTRDRDTHLANGQILNMTWKGNFKDLNPELIEITKVNSQFFIEISCSNCIKAENKTNGISELKYSVSKALFGPFLSSEANLDERLKKALKHLIVLFGGQKEPF